MKIFHLLLLCVGFAIGGCRLIELGGESFKKTIERDGKRDLWLIEFYAPWCSHCKTLEPVLEQTSEVLEGRLKIARVDGTRHRLLVAQHKIKSYPWLEYFHEGEFKQYPCSRSLQGFSTFADRMLEGEEVKRVSSKMDLKRLLDVSHVAFLLISPSSPPPSISDPFYEVAGELRGGADFGVVENYDMREDLLGLHLISRQALMIEESAFILKLEVNPDLGTTSFNLDDIHSLFFEPRVHPLTGDANYSSSALRSFVTSHNMKLVNSFDLAHHKSFHTGNRLMVCGVVDYSQPSNTYRFISRFSKAAEVAREEFGEERFVFVHMDGLALNDFVKQLFADATPPHLVVIDQENQLFYESKTAVYSSKDIMEFLRGVEAGTEFAYKGGYMGLPSYLLRRIQNAGVWSLVYFLPTVLLFYVCCCWPTGKKKPKEKES